MFDLEKSSGVGIAQIKSCVFYPRPPNKNYNDDDAMGSLEYLIINQFAANDSQFGVDEEDTGRTGHGMMRQCMRQCMAEDGRMGEGWRKHGMMRHGGMMGPLAMRIIFALMDRDSDGTVSLEEFQAAHERIFKAMDPDKDGTVSQEEMLDFMRGPDKSAPQH